MIESTTAYRMPGEGLTHSVNTPPKVIAENTDTRWTNNTIYNHFENPMDFMRAVIDAKATSSSKAKDLIKEGEKKFAKIKEKNITYDKLYQDVALKVRDKLKARGFTTSMLYSNVEFTTEKTGCMSKQRAMLGRKDCYYKDTRFSDGKIFHDIYINLSYSFGVSDKKIRDNSYALFALCNELRRLIPMRVFVVNHVGTDTPTCYSYCLKKFRQPIDPYEFLFFTSDSKRTFGWATYEILVPGGYDSTVGRPEGTVSIDEFNLDKEIDDIWEKFSKACVSKTQGF